jgi:Bacterial tandem repeat domain 1/CHAP domain
MTATSPSASPSVPRTLSPSGEAIVQTAIAQIGRDDGDCPAPGCFNGNGGEWCSEFVSWVYNQAGAPFTGGGAGGWLLSNTTKIRNWFSAHATYLDRSVSWSGVEPQPGDYVFISRVGTDREHSGIVEYVDVDGALHTIEGNNAGRRVGRYVYPNFRTNTTSNLPANTNGYVAGLGLRPGQSTDRYVLMMDQRQGPAWFARHALTPQAYQQHFDQFVPQGYRPTIAQGYTIGGQERYILVMEQRQGAPWLARHGLTPQAYQQHFDEFVPKGYRPTIAQGYSAGGQEKYILVMEQRQGAPWLARHGLTPQAYQQHFDEFVPKGYRPVIAQGYQAGGQERYILVMEQRQGAPWLARHGLTPQAYQQHFDEFVPKGYRPIIAQAYTVAGQQRYVLVMEQSGGPAWFARHGLTPQMYQQHFDAFVPKGYRPVIAQGNLV